MKLIARRSNSLPKYIIEKNEEIAQFNLEQKPKKGKEAREWKQNLKTGVLENGLGKAVFSSKTVHMTTQGVWKRK